MTNAKDFSLESELAETAGWDLDESEITLEETDDGWASGYADEPDPEEWPEEWPEDAELTVGMQDLAERHALRRVAGLSTELEDISEVEYRQLRLERVVLVGVWTTRSVEDAENSMAELALLAEEPARLDGARRDLPAAQQAGPGDVHRSRQGRRPARDGAGHRCRHRHLRRRARAQPAEEPQGPAQGPREGGRPDRADPEHLRPAREVRRGPGAGRARAAELHEAAAPRLGRPALPPGRRTGRRRRRRHRWTRSGRDQDRDGPAPDEHQDRQAASRARAGI